MKPIKPMLLLSAIALMLSLGNAYAATQNGCVDRAMQNYFNFIVTVHRNYNGQSLSNDKKSDLQRQRYLMLNRQNLSGCPVSFKDAHRNLVYAVKSYWDEGSIRSMPGGSIPLWGVTDEEYQRTKKQLQNEEARYVDAATPYLQDPSPELRRLLNTIDRLF